MAKGRLLDKVKKVVTKVPVAGTLVEGATRAMRTVEDTLSRGSKQVLSGRRRAASEEEAPREAGEAAPTKPVSRPAQVNAPGRAPRMPAVVRATPDGRRAERERTGTAAERRSKTEGRASGRKTLGTDAAAPRRATGRGKKGGAAGFKVKRGQKHHHHR